MFIGLIYISPDMFGLQSFYQSLQQLTNALAQLLQQNTFQIQISL